MKLCSALSLLTLFWSTAAAAQPAPSAGRAPVPRRATYELTDGRTLEGTPLNLAVADDIQLRTDDGRVQLLRKNGSRYRVVTSQVDWASYDGSPNGNRYTTLTHINKSNVSRLAPKWIYTIQNTNRLRGDTRGGQRNHVRDGNQRVLRLGRRQRA
jgi:glucose dehydrogenase